MEEPTSLKMVGLELDELFNFLRNCPKDSWFFGERKVSRDVQRRGKEVKTLREISLQRLCNYIETNILQYRDFEEIFQILDSLPTLNSLTYFWEQLDNEVHSLILQWLFQNTALCKTYGLRFQSSASYIAWEQTGLVQTIQLLNNFDLKGLYLRLTFTYRLPELEKLTQLHGLDELILRLADRTEVESLLRAWHSYLRLYPQAWKRLVFLEIPALFDLKLLYDTLLLLPSLRRIVVGVQEENISDIPILKSILTPFETLSGFRLVNEGKDEPKTVVDVHFRKRTYLEGYTNSDLPRGQAYLINGTSLEALKRSKRRARRADHRQSGPTPKIPRYRKFGLFENAFSKPRERG